MNPIDTAATKNQTITLTPRTANMLAATLGSFADSVNAPHLKCDAEKITELDLQRIITLATLSVGTPSDAVFGLS